MKSKLTKLSKSFYDKHKNEIKDIILFGSFIRGKEKPNDIDILMLFRNKINKDIEYEFRKLFDGENIAVISKTEAALVDPSFDARESILFEGYSLINQRYLASEYGFDSIGLFFYSTRGMSNLTKTKFYYALNGRGTGSGAIYDWDGIKFSDNVIAVPLVEIEAAKMFFDYWHIDYKLVPSLIPQRFNNRKIIGKKQ